jgi:hypothetical protein
MPQIQEEGTTRYSQHGSNGIQLLLVIEVERTYKSKDPHNGMDFISPYEMANPRNCKLGLLPKRRNMAKMNFKPSVEEDLQWKMFINMKDFKNRMVSTGTE